MIFNDSGFNVLEWPGTSPYLNPHKSAWNVMKNEMQEARPINIRDLVETLRKPAVHVDVSYFVSLGESTLRRPQMVLQQKGNVIKS